MVVQRIDLKYNSSDGFFFPIHSGNKLLLMLSLQISVFSHGSKISIPVYWELKLRIETNIKNTRFHGLYPSFNRKKESNFDIG